VAVAIQDRHLMPIKRGKKQAHHLPRPPAMMGRDYIQESRHPMPESHRRSTRKFNKKFSFFIELFQEIF
jgi:hypothetical protein